MDRGKHVLNEAKVFEGYTSKEAFDDSVIVNDSVMARFSL